MAMRLVTFPLAAALVVSAGCASLSPREGFPGVERAVSERGGARIVWNNGTEDDKAAQSAVVELLSLELTADAAVQVALLGNRHLQAEYEELGIAQADLVQAGLLSNPVFTALVQLPDSGGGTALTLSVSQNFIELLSLPLRRKIAAAQYETIKARVAGRVLELSGDVKEAHCLLAWAQQAREMRATVLEAVLASLDAAERLHEAGNITGLTLDQERALAAQARLDLTAAEAQIVARREALAALLGLADSTDVRAVTRLPELPDAEPDLADVEALALRQRLDLLAVQREAGTAAAELGLKRRFTWLDDVEVEVEAERETDGGWLTGPGVSAPIPIFDTGAAGKAAAGGRLNQAEHRARALATDIRSQARAARGGLLAARERVLYFRREVLPLRRRITEATQLEYNGMLVGVFDLLRAKREEIDAGRDALEALRDYWLARNDVERAIGGNLPVTPAAEPATPPAEPTHDHHH